MFIDRRMYEFCCIDIIGCYLVMKINELKLYWKYRV